MIGREMNRGRRFVVAARHRQFAARREDAARRNIGKIGELAIDSGEFVGTDG